MSHLRLHWLFVVCVLLFPLVARAGVPLPASIPGLAIEPWAHESAVPPLPPGFGTLSNWPPMELDPPADVLHYDLDLRFGIADTTIQGTATLRVRWGSATDGVLRLDAIGFPVHAVRGADGRPLAFTQDGNGIAIAFAPAPQRCDEVVVAIDYVSHRSPSFFIPGNAAFTFSEPEGARFWFPCRDVPWDKATLSLHGRVPADRTLVGNGVLDSVTIVGAEKIFHWREAHPVATYLIGVAISDYVHVRVPSTVTDLGWYVYPSDVAAADTAFQNLPDMIAFYDSTLVPYRFDKYVMCEAPFGGGMEHQSATLMGQFVVTAGTRIEWLTAHELAHHWFGDLVTPGGWAHKWLNEGGAVFYEAVWQGHRYGPEKFAARMHEAQDLVFEAERLGLDHPIVDPAPQNFSSRMEYFKAAWVYHMLRELLGKPRYDAAIVEYLIRHGFGNATTADLRAVMEAHYGGSLDWFFEEWLYGTGHPNVVYVPSFSFTGTTWLIDVDVYQTQSGTQFRYPLEVRIDTEAGPVFATGWVEGPHRALHFFTFARPTAVTLDPNDKILDESRQSALSVPDGTRSGGLAAWPNPFAGRLTIQAAPGARIEIFDLRGRRVRSLAPATGLTRVWDGADDSGRRAAPGIYLVRSATSEGAVRVVLLDRSR